MIGPPVPARALAALAAIAGLVAGLVSGCSATGPGSVIRIGVAVDQPGMGMRTGDTYTGFDIDVARTVAHSLGYADKDIRWVPTSSAQRETLLATDQADLVVAAYSITDDRRDKVTFAGPYFLAGQDLLVEAGRTDITGPASITGKRVCSVRGSTSAQRVKDRFPGVRLLELSTSAECAGALSEGTVDAVTSDDTVLAGLAASPDPGVLLRVVGRPFSVERYGIGMAKDDTALCTLVTDALKEMIDDGDWRRAVVANLGPSGYRPHAGNPPRPTPCE